MKRIFFMLLVTASVAATSAYAQNPVTGKQWTVQDIYRNGGPTGEPPKDLVWSPNGRLLTFVSPDNQIGEEDDIVQVDAATGKASVLASHSRIAGLSGGHISEQDRDHRSRYELPSYIWADDSRHLLLDTTGQLWLYDTANGTGIQIASTGAGSGDDPKFSPDSKYVSYIRDHNLYVHALNSTTQTPLTRTDTNAVLNGEVDWVYLEELSVRSNYFWSPDSSKIAYLQMNEDAVPRYPITDWIPTHAAVEYQHYPQPGDNNPNVRVGVVNIKNAKTNWIKLPGFSDHDDYIPRFGWVDRKTVYIEVLKRSHKELDLYFADVDTGMAAKIYSITDAKYLDENYDITFLKNGKFLMTNWQDGHTHIYLYGYNEKSPLANEAAVLQQLTKGDFEVDSVAGVDEATQTVYYISNEGDPLQKQLWSVQLSGQGKRQLTHSNGVHEVVVSPDGTHFSDITSSMLVPPTASVCALNDRCEIFWKSHPLDAAYKLNPPTILHLKAKDGTLLYGSLTLPDGAASPASVPLIVNPYGGTHAQTVMDKWGGSGLLFDQLLAQHGFAVLHVDNRGMGGRGRDFEQFSYHNFGPVQLEDQLTAMDEVLAKYPQLDANHLGWWGWSWGGHFTLYAMTHSDRFKAGVAVAPVTDWKNYDSIYTERYMGTPSDDPDAYKQDSDVNFAANLKGHLLLAHGTGDDNVHILNSVQMIQKFIDVGVPYDFQIFPRKTHSIAGYEARTELFNRILSQFEMYLK